MGPSSGSSGSLGCSGQSRNRGGRDTHPAPPGLHHEVGRLRDPVRVWSLLLYLLLPLWGPDPHFTRASLCTSGLPSLEGQAAPTSLGRGERDRGATAGALQTTSWRRSTPMPLSPRQGLFYEGPLGPCSGSKPRRDPPFLPHDLYPPSTPSANPLPPAGSRGISVLPVGWSRRPPALGQACRPLPTLPAGGKSRNVPSVCWDESSRAGAARLRSRALPQRSPTPCGAASGDATVTGDGPCGTKETADRRRPSPAAARPHRGPVPFPAVTLEVLRGPPPTPPGTGSGLGAAEAVFGSGRVGFAPPRRPCAGCGLRGRRRGSPAPWPSGQARREGALGACGGAGQHPPAALGLGSAATAPRDAGIGRRVPPASAAPPDF